MRHISREATFDHYVVAAYQSCRAQMVDRDLQWASQRALLLGTVEAKRRAVCRYLLAMGKLFELHGYEIDTCVFEMFDRHPFPRPAEWDGTA